MFPFLLELSEAQNVLLTWNFVVWCFIPVHKETKISNFRTSCNFKYSNVLISHLFLYNEGNTWVDTKDQPQPREQRSPSSLIYYWIVFPGNCSQKVLDHWRAKEEKGIMKQLSFRVLAKQIFKTLPRSHFLMEKGAIRKFLTGSGYRCEKYHNFVLMLSVFCYVILPASELRKNTLWLCSSFAWV